MIALLGPPPPSLLARASLRSKFFSDEGECLICSCVFSCNTNFFKGDFSAGIPLPRSRTLGVPVGFIALQILCCVLALFATRSLARALRAPSRTEVELVH